MIEFYQGRNGLNLVPVKAPANVKKIVARTLIVSLPLFS